MISIRKAIITAAFAAASLTLFASSAHAQSADVGVTKSGPVQAAAGADVTYTITVFNVGPNDATSVDLNDPLPEGMTFVSLTQTSGPTFTCTTPPVASGGTVDCTLATLLNGAAASFQLTANITPQTPPGVTFTNIATVTASSFDPNDENNTSAVATTVPAPNADLAIMKSGPSSAAAGSQFQYTVMVSNFGPDSAQNATFNDVLPGGLNFVSVTPPSGWTCPTTPPVGSSGTVTCTIATFGMTSPFAPQLFTITVDVPAATPSGTQFTNQATISSDTVDSDEDNNSSTTSTTVASSDIFTTISGPATAAPGADVVYTVIAGNNGPDIAQSFAVQIDSALSTTFVSVVQNSGPAVTCNTPVSGTYGSVTCGTNTLSPGSSVQLTLTLHVIPSASGSITTVSSVTSSQADPNTTDNMSSTTATVVPSSDVAVTKSGPGSVTAGSNASYTVTVMNNGPSDASSVALTDAVPAGSTFVSVTQGSGPVFSCTAPPVGGTGTVSCSIATLAANASATFTITLKANSNATGINNIATVSSSSSDPSSTNNSATAVTTVNALADLSVTKSGPSTVVAGTTVTYTITVANAGPSPASSVSLSDAIPGGTVFRSFTQTSGSAFSCTLPAVNAGGTILCTAASLAATASATFTLLVDVSPRAVGPVVNTATVTTSTTESSSANNSATTTAALSSQADISVTKNGPATAAGGTNVTYTITVANAGPSDAANFTLTDNLPAGSTFVSETQSSGPTFNCTTPAVGSGGAVVCTLASRPVFGLALAPAETAAFTITVATVTNGGISLNNSATVTSTTPDPNPADNTATTATTVPLGPADLSITKTTTTTTAVAGATVNFTITVANAGPADASSVVVTDVLPANLSYLSATPSQGTCSGTTTVTCNLGTVLNGSTATITLSTRVGGTPGTTTNNASVTAANADPASSNNTAGASITVASAPGAPSLSPLGLAGLAMLLALAGMLLLRGQA
jgi:uncharacterized repeat protein (TIGR01451 family)